MRIYQLDEEAVIVIRGKMEKDEALETIIRLVCNVYDIGDFEEIYKLIFERESSLTTGIGLEVAVPHCRIKSVAGVVAGALLAPRGIDYNSVDGKPVKLILLLISSEHDVSNHLACLSSVSHAVSDENSRLRLLQSTTPAELYENIIKHIKY